MIRGDVSRAWAKRHHRVWYDQMRGRFRGGEMNRGRWEARIRRAGELAAAHPFAAEGLRFYERIAGFQKSLYSGVEAACGSVREARPSARLRDELDFFLLLRVPGLSRARRADRPGALARPPRPGRNRAPRWQEALHRFWRAGGTAAGRSHRGRR